MAQAAQDRDKFHEAAVTRQLKLIEPCVPVWDSTIKIFQSRLTEYLQTLHQKLIADCDGLQKRPEDLALGYYPDSGYGDRSTKVCEMSIRTNSDWSCVAATVMRERMETTEYCSLALSSTWMNQQATLNVYVRNDVVSTTISRRGTSLTLDESHPVASNQTAMASVIDDFIAAQASAFGVQP